MAASKVHPNAKSALIAMCLDLATLPYADERDRECSIAAAMADALRDHFLRVVDEGQQAELSALRDRLLEALCILPPLPKQTGL